MYLKLFILATLSCLAVISYGETSKPNVIFIMADDLGGGMLGHNGQKIVTTPHIDKLAAEGMSFSNYYGNPYCAPARWSLLTGMHNGRKNSASQLRGGVIPGLDAQKLTPEKWQEKFDALKLRRAPIPDNEVFLAQVAQKAGYHTAQFGKLDIGFLTWDSILKRHGWDFYEGYYDHARAHGFYPTYLWRNGEKFYLKGNTKANAGKMSETGTEPVGSGGETYSQDVFVKGMLKYIRDHKDSPFFLYHSTQLPHGPVAVTKLHPDYENRKDLTLSEKKYATMVKDLDNTVGSIMAELKAQGIDDNTIVFFCSDNGHETYYVNAKGDLPKKNWRSYKKSDGTKANLTDNKWRTSTDGDTFDGAGGRAGLKWSALQGGVNCPMIVRWNNEIQPGSRTALLSTHYDFMATLAEIVGQPTPAKKDSVSYLPTLTGKEQSKGRDWIFIQAGGRMARSALITRDGWKLLQLDNKKFQLYNILKDPMEEDNIESKHPDVVKKLIPIFNAQLNSPRVDLE